MARCKDGAVRSRAADVRVIHEDRINLGKGSAFRIGLTYATGDVVIAQDADLELDPAEYAALLAPILRGETNVVNGSRFLRPVRIPRLMRARNLAITAVANALYGARLTDVLSAYKVFRRDAVDARQLRATGFEIEAELCATFLRACERIVEVPVSYRPRTAAQGKKIRWTDAIPIVATLVSARFAPPADGVRARPRARDA